jgi:hypothetical protein
MPRIVVLLLGVTVSSIATGFGLSAGAAESATPRGTSPPPAATRAAGELTDGELLFQGMWQLTNPGSGFLTGALRIDGHDFCAETVHGSYVGYVSIRSDTSPAQVDFTIQDCECKFDGMTSAGIYYEDDGAIVFVAPAPGAPRPEGFEGLDETKVMIERATRAAGTDQELCALPSN